MKKGGRSESREWRTFETPPRECLLSASIIPERGSSYTWKQEWEGGTQRLPQAGRWVGRQQLTDRIILGTVKGRETPVCLPGGV